MDIVAAGVDNEGIGQLFPKKPARPCAPATPADDSACPLVECRDWARRVSSDLCFRFRFRWGRRKRVIEFLFTRGSISARFRSHATHDCQHLSYRRWGQRVFFLSVYQLLFCGLLQGDEKWD